MNRQFSSVKVFLITPAGERGCAGEEVQGKEWRGFVEETGGIAPFLRVIEREEERLEGKVGDGARSLSTGRNAR